MDYIRADDVADRILRRKMHWFHGKPMVLLEGNQGEFGKLSLDFGDEVVSWSIFIRDRDTILDATFMAVENFSAYVKRLWEES